MESKSTDSFPPEPPLSPVSLTRTSSKGFTDYSNLDTVLATYPQPVIQAVCSLYRDYGRSDYIGEAICQWEHALQAAYMGSRAGADEETILAALFHDIGHILALKNPSEQGSARMGACGALYHEHLGADYLRSLGFSEKICTLVRRHVDAKRYLTYSQPSYYDKLSEASRITLKYQGGPMSEAEAKLFDQDPLKKTILIMRTWDEKAKMVNWVGPGFDAYVQLMLKHCSAPDKAATYEPSPSPIAARAHALLPPLNNNNNSKDTLSTPVSSATSSPSIASIDPPSSAPEPSLPTSAAHVSATLAH